MADKLVKQIAQTAEGRRVITLERKSKISYPDKVNFNENFFTPADENKIITAEDMNEIKMVVNNNANKLQATETKMAGYDPKFNQMETGLNTLAGYKTKFNQAVSGVSISQEFWTTHSAVDINIKHDDTEQMRNANEFWIQDEHYDRNYDFYFVIIKLKNQHSTAVSFTLNRRVPRISGFVYTQTVLWQPREAKPTRFTKINVRLDLNQEKYKLAGYPPHHIDVIKITHATVNGYDVSQIYDDFPAEITILGGKWTLKVTKGV